MIELRTECPVCNGPIVIKSKMSGWWRNEEEGGLKINIKVDLPFFASGDKLLCSKVCDATYRDAKERANKAYDAIMADYQ